MRARIFVGGLGLLFVLYLLPSAEPAVPTEEYHIAMGTVVRIALYLHDDGDGERFFKLAVAEIDRVDSLMSRHGDASELRRVNSTSGAPTPCSPDLRRVVERCLLWSRLSGGAYDATIGPLTDLWAFPEAEIPPAAPSITAARALVDHRQVDVGPEGVRLARPGMSLDLGGSAKGYAVDRAVAALIASGVGAGLVEAGGDIRFWGVKPDGRDWQFGIQHPRRAQEYLVVEDVGLPALATSGDYEQTFEHGGRRYHHLLDPSTGYPATRAVSASAWSESALDADILATAAFVMGPEKGIALIDSVIGAEGVIFCEEEGRLRYYASSGLAGRLQNMEGAALRDAPAGGNAEPSLR